MNQTMLETYAFNQSTAVSVTPWGNDVIIFLLLIIAACSLFQVAHMIFWRNKLV
jgi:hypothetical protein